MMMLMLSLFGDDGYGGHEFLTRPPPHYHLKAMPRGFLRMSCNVAHNAHSIWPIADINYCICQQQTIFDISRDDNWLSAANTHASRRTGYSYSFIQGVKWIIPRWL